MSKIDKLFKFIETSPTAFHTVATITDALKSNGYVELYETDSWENKTGKFYVKRADSSIIAFRLGEARHSFNICATHSDQPAFAVKANEQKGSAYAVLDTEKYGGMIHYTWLDRPLGIAGRVVLKSDSGLKKVLCNLDTTVTIPSVAIHFNRGVNDGYKFNPAVDMLPLYSLNGGTALIDKIAESLSVDKEDIISHELYVYNKDNGVLFGADEEFALCPRLDDLACVYASVNGFFTAKSADSIPVLAVFNNEEVGSSTKQGAASTFLYDVLTRIAGDSETYQRMLANSFMLSADNAHAIHPNHPELSDSKNAPTLCGGVVVKYNANVRYTTDSVSAGIFYTLADRCGVKTQDFYNRADTLGGSTLGAISNTVVSVPTVDIGLPQLAMHSANETMGVSDLDDMCRVIAEFYSTTLRNVGDNIIF